MKEQISAEVRVFLCLCVCPYAILKVLKSQSKSSEGFAIASRSRGHNNDSLLRKLYYKANLKLFPKLFSKGVLEGFRCIRPHTGFMQIEDTQNSTHYSRTPFFILPFREHFSPSNISPFLIQGAEERFLYSNCADVPKFRVFGFFDLRELEVKDFQKQN